MVIRKDTFYFLKVELGIDECEEVAAVERMKHGPEYLWLWMRLALRYTNYDGVLCRRVGDEVYPVSPDDIAAEMHGSFTDVTVRDGVAVLIQAKLIYVNSEGFMAITGLTISGDPLEPVLHKRNDNRTDIRPLSVGNDSKTAAYHRAYRARIKEREQQKLIGTHPTKMLSYTEISIKASCAKQTVSNWVKKLNLEDRVFMDGQKKMLPENIAIYLICSIKGTRVPESILDSLRLDGLDGLRPLSNTVQKPSNRPSITVQQPSNNFGQPSNTYVENPDKISTLDGFANANMDTNMDAILDANIPSFENNRILEVDDDSNNARESVQNRPNLGELFAVGFDRDPDETDMALLADLYKHTDYNQLLLALKKARLHKAESVAYVKRCIDNIGTNVDDYSIRYNPNTFVDPNRDLSKLISVFRDEYIPVAPGDYYRESLNTFISLAVYYSDIELLRTIKFASIHQDFRPDSLRFFAKFSLTEYDDDLDKEYLRFCRNVHSNECFYSQLGYR